MIGLIKYDLMQIYSGIKGGFVALYLAFMAVLNVFGGTGNIFSMIIIFVFAMFGIAAFNYEEAYHWDRYVAALPVSGRQIVLARYGMIGICMAAGVAASLLLGCISMIAGTMELSMTDYVLLLVQCLAIAVLYMEIMVPVMYRFGAERGRIIMLVLFMIFFGILTALGTLTYEWTQMIPVYRITLLIAVAAAVLLPLSIAVSVRIRTKKAF